MDTFLSIRADLHVHTVASACAEAEMIPPLIVERARRLGLGMIGVTDHHSVENVKALREAASSSGLAVLPGMEVQTREEVHIICFFEDMDRAEQWQTLIWNHLPPLPNREEYFGCQYLVNADGNCVGINKRLLQASVDLSFEAVLELTASQGGLAIPAHVDRPRFSLFGSLGMIPEGIDFIGMEISPRLTKAEAFRLFPSLKGMGVIQSGDAHRLSDMINSTRLFIQDLSIKELCLAFQGRMGRKVFIDA